MLAATIKLLRTASIAICLIVVASFAVFAVDQTKSASANQTEQLKVGTGKPTKAGTPAAQNPPAARENSVHKALDETSNTLTSPFSGVVSSSDSEWVTRGVRMLFALIVYGFGLGYLARMLRVRV